MWKEEECMVRFYREAVGESCQLRLCQDGKAASNTCQALHGMQHSQQAT